MEAIEELIKQLQTILQPWRAYLIAVDGRDGVGKSPLSRYMAWKLEVPLVETDLYLANDDCNPAYHMRELKRVLQSRLNHNRPVIVEGIFIRRLLKSLDLTPDFVVHVTRPECEGSLAWEVEFLAYESEFQPESADQQISWLE